VVAVANPASKVFPFNVGELQPKETVPVVLSKRVAVTWLQWSRVIARLRGDKNMKPLENVPGAGATSSSSGLSHTPARKLSRGNIAQLLDEIAGERVQVEVSAVRILFELLGFLLGAAIADC
jgi:hypothetical protein